MVRCQAASREKMHSVGLVNNTGLVTVCHFWPSVSAAVRGSGLSGDLARRGRHLAVPGTSRSSWSGASIWRPPYSWSGAS